KQEVHTIEGKETITVNGESVALVWLGTVLGLPQREYSTINQALVLTGGGRRLALAVDSVEQEQEVLVKPLGPQLVRVRNIAGATVLGSGGVVPILNVADLMLSALQGGVAPEQPGERARKRMDRPVSVLVVEDSITARTLLKGILEGVGYRVTTAVDGVDALTQLRTGEFDIVVSDVDMPRMNGFELTARIRSDRKLGDLPVVLVTALDSREDRERGVEAGANAYIVKSSFDQSNLLETVQRLVG
ncbi:MAG TPA: response regulator, partial [Bacteroidota bacterium]|nr:response regulator [Bacteroidota bacterium]